MSETTKIEWTDATFNPWIGCTKVSPGCKNCYAEKTGARLSVVWGDAAPRRIASDAYWREPLRWNRAAEKSGVRRRVFCASLSDVFEDREELNAPRARLWRLIEKTPHLDWLLLTKRPENADKLAAGASADCFGDGEDMPLVWPRNVWLGTTVEDQAHADERIPHLLRTPAAVRFVSAEPLLEAVDLLRVRWWPEREHRVDVLRCGYWSVPELVGRDGFVNHSDMPGPIDWVIVGGESGPGARPFDIAWARSLVTQCRAAKVPVFVKQMGARPVDNVEPTGNFREGQNGKRQFEIKADVLSLASRKGNDPAEWPEDLRVREMPEVRS